MFIMEEETKNKSKADIRIVGVGGGGSNAIETMIQEGIQGVRFIAVNTDHQALDNSSAETKIQLGSKLTKGLGAGANPETGRRAAVESYEEIVQILQGADMIFVTAGMGGGTGTGGAPLVAQAADELGLLTVGIVTKPFLFEGQKRMRQAEQGIREMRNYVDTLIVIPNEKLLEVSKKDTPLLETFKLTDNVLLQAVKGIAELVSVPGLINLDFADIKTVMLNKGMAIMGRGVAEGEDRAKKAICLAISSPLLEGVSIKGATGMIVNITANSSLSLIDVQEASSILTQLADVSADIIVGTVIDENMGDKLSVTVIATGFKNEGKLNSDNVFLPHGQGVVSDFPEVEKFSNEKLKDNNLFQPRSFQFEEQKISQEKAPPAKNEKPSAKKSEFSEKNIEDEFVLIKEKDDDSNAIDEPIDKRSNDLKKGNLDSNNRKQKQEILKMENPTEPDSKVQKKSSPKEILLSKVKEYEVQKKRNEAVTPENQISIDWKESQLEEDPSSPFESSVDFSDEDMV